MNDAIERIEEARARPFRRYSAYRDSGVEWLGEIPKGWEVGRLKDHGALVGGAGFPHDYQGTDNEVLPFYKVGDLSTSSDGRYMGQARNTVSLEIAAELRAHVIPVDSIIYAKIGAALLLNRRRITTMPCCIDNNMSAYVPRRGALASEWAFHWTTIVDFAALANPGAVPSLSEGDQVDIPIVIPPMSEQRAIAAFLDRETAKIDGLVARKERLIELLQEKRTSLITRAVTRELDPNAPMKDSGVEWLGEIPAHWEVRRIAMAVNKITNGYVGPTRDIFVDDGVPYLQSLHIKNGQIEFDRKHYFVTKHWSKQHRKSVLREGDVLVVQTGDIGQNCAVPGAFEGANCHALIILRLKPNLGEGAFLSLLLQSTYGQNALKWSQTGALHPHLECGHVREIPLVLPPPEEQRLIMRRVGEQLEALDSLQAKVRQAIDHHKEFRTALISAAVTGKIDVREEAS